MKTKIFLNLSNHPSSNWSAEQIQAAEKFGEIVDMPFPNISPSADSTEIKSLAEEYFNKIKELKNVKAIHLMGEMTFTFQLVGKLKENNYTVLASTSERIAEEKDGKKIVSFKFVQFREY